LRAAWRRPEVREAVFLASPELDAGLQRAEASASSDAATRAFRSLTAYFSRMAARSTPFGLLAGSSVGVLDAHTCLELPARAGYRRRTRLDMDYLSALIDALEADPQVRAGLCYRPNSSLCRVGGRLHYAESRPDTHGRTHHLVAVDVSPELLETLEHAAAGATLPELARRLVSDDISCADAAAFVDELASSQVLVSDLGPDLTGGEAIDGLIGRLARQARTQPLAACLTRVRQELACADQAGVGGNATERYTAIHANLEQLPAKPNLARLFQADLVKSARLTLGPGVVSELSRGLDLLHRMSQPADGPDALQAFKGRFTARYEQAEVPLLEALDEEIGIGFASPQDPGGEPLLQGLGPLPGSPEPRTWHARDDVLLRLLLDATRGGVEEIELGEAELEALAPPDSAAPLPDAIAVYGRLAASSVEAVDRGDFRFWLQGASGPSGAWVFGRFCHADPELHQRVMEHLRAEEARRPEAVFAEIVHLPEGRLGNILSRPVLRDYEIPYLGQSGAATERQIPLTDLRVAVRNDRVVLRSARLDREVVPRLTSAHNFGRLSTGVYRFLCALQRQGTVEWLDWSWGTLEQATHLPRVVSGRLVLARARWNVSAAELRPLLEAHGDGQVAAIRELRAARSLPRYVALADDDNELVVDFDNVVSVETFLHLVERRPGVRLVELFPGPDKLCVTGPEGRFLNELVVPFVRDPMPAKPRVHTPTSGTVRRRFPPGSEWLYAKLYVGQALTDRVLVDGVGPAVDAALTSGAADSWFFIRYADPEPHLRLRVHGDPRRLTSEVLPTLSDRLTPLVDDGLVARWQLDTYVREVERYGGERGILLAERLFCVDSTCVLAVVRGLPGDEGLAWRWKVALYGVDQLLDALGFTLEAKQQFVRQRRDTFARWLRADDRLRRQLGHKHRTERQALDELLRLGRGPVDAVPALRQRTQELAPIVEELQALQRTGELLVSLSELAGTYTHMHVNRSLRSEQLFQELVMYDLLDRLYRTQLVLEGQATKHADGC
jgi:thiopeptide-type bacteriocin biosynthesis protein